MMRLIRKAVYAMGFFPKYDTILFSPTLNVLKRHERAVKDIPPPTIVNLSMPCRTAVHDDTQLIKNMLWTVIKYCPVCGEVLWEIGKKKVCRNNCAEAGFMEDSNGLPIIAFGAIQEKDKT